MASWDIFHADRLELERGLSTEAVRQGLAAGQLQEDDLVRPAGTTVPWTRLADLPELSAVPPSAGPAAVPVIEAPVTPPPSPARRAPRLEDFEEVQPRLDEIVPPPTPRDPTKLPETDSTSDVAFPVLKEQLRPKPTEEPAPRAGWVWDDEDEEEGDEDGGDDVEELADDSAFNGERSGPPPPGPAAGPKAPEPWLAETQVDRLTEEPPEALAGLSLDPAHHPEGQEGRPDSRSSHVALPVVRSRDRGLGGADDGADEEESSISLSRSATQKIEELDLAPMVDVAFQLVLFFMVTATTVLYKTLEIPKPSPESPAGAVAQGRSRTLDELKDDYILVEIDDRGAMKLDREPIEPAMNVLVEQFRRAREKTGRKTMLLSADFATRHRNAVLAYDAANEIGLGIAIARPPSPQGPAPTLKPAPRPAAPAPASAS